MPRLYIGSSYVLLNAPWWWFSAKKAVAREKIGLCVKMIDRTHEVTMKIYQEKVVAVDLSGNHEATEDIHSGGRKQLEDLHWMQVGIKRVCGDAEAPSIVKLIY